MATIAVSMFEMNVPNDGLVHDWTFKGVTYLMNSYKCVWERDMDGEPGNWVGILDLERGIIDTSVPEPEYEDEGEDFYVHLQQEGQQWEAPPNG